MILGYIKKISKSLGKYRFLRIAIYLAIFFFLIPTLALNTLLLQSVNPEGLAYDPCRFDYEDSNLTIPHLFLGKEAHFNDVLEMDITLKFEDEFGIILPAFSVTGMDKNISRFSDFEIISGSFRSDEVYISRSMWNEIREEYTLLHIGDEITLSLNYSGIKVSKKYIVGGVIEDRWIYSYLYHRTGEILVPISFFSSIPRYINIHGFNESVYTVYTAARVPEKYVPLLAETYGGISYSVEKSKNENEYLSSLFVTGNLYLLFLLLGGGVSIYTAFINGKKYAGEIGVLRAWGVPAYKIVLFFSLENLYAIILSALIALLITTPFNIGFFIGLYRHSPYDMLITLLLFPLLFAFLLCAPSILYFYYIIRRKHVILHLRNM